MPSYTDQIMQFEPESFTPTTEKLSRTGLYALADYVPYDIRKIITAKLGIELDATNYHRWFRKNIAAKMTGEKRPPKAGEWYLSGAIIGAYLATNDLTTSYYIAKLVHVEKHVTVHTIETDC